MIYIVRVDDMELYVIEALKNYKSAREDDYILFGCVLKKYKPELLDMSLRDILLKHKELGVPYIESISRCRRKVQANNPNLKGPRQLEDMRKQVEGKYYKYAKK